MTLGTELKDNYTFIQAPVKPPVGELIVTKSGTKRVTNLVKVYMKSTLALTAGYLRYGRVKLREQKDCLLFTKAGLAQDTFPGCFLAAVWNQFQGKSV